MARSRYPITAVFVALFSLATSCQPRAGSPRVPTSVPPSPTSTVALVATPSLATATRAQPPPVHTPTPQGTALVVQVRAAQTVLSPDGSLVANLYDEYTHPSGFQAIEITTPNGTLLWSIPYEDQPTTGDPRPNLAIEGWSPDGESLYFYRSFFYDGVSTLWSGFKLQGINTTSGRIATLIPSEGLMAFAFSRDFTRLAYVLDEDDPRVLYVRDLHSGEITNFKTNIPGYDAGQYNQAGSIFWSDSGERLVLFTATNDERAAMYMFDLAEVSSKRILDFHTDQYLIDDWSLGGTLRLNDVFEGLIKSLDLKTGAVTVLGTPTPKP